MVAFTLLQKEKNAESQCFVTVVSALTGTCAEICLSSCLTAHSQAAQPTTVSHDIVWLAHLPEGRRCLPWFNTAEACQLNSAMWEGRQAEMNHRVSSEILFSALFKALNHKTQDHCV